MQEVLFQPNPESMAREIGEVVSIDGDVVTIRWSGVDYLRDRRADFLREVV